MSFKGIVNTEVHPYNTLEGLCHELALSHDAVSDIGFLRGGIWFSDTKTIIIGTFPPQREYVARRGYLHYSSSWNQFWKHIDAIYGTKYFIPNKISKIEQLRIANAKEKIHFAKQKSFGFVDIFSEIERRVSSSSKDVDIRGVSTIFDTGLFAELMDANVKQLIFVYSLAMRTFFHEIELHYNTRPVEKVAYNSAGILSSTYIVTILDKTIILTYCPIHGRNSWNKKQQALKLAIEKFEL